MWSIGIILYMMLSGDYPFSMKEIEKEVTETPLLFLGPVWNEITPQCKDLIGKMLAKDSGERITAE